MVLYSEAWNDLEMRTCELVLRELRPGLDFPSTDLIIYTHLKPLLNDLLPLLMPFSHRHLHIFIAQWKHSRAPLIYGSVALYGYLLFTVLLAFRNAEQEGMPHCGGNLSKTILTALHSTPNFHPQFFFFFFFFFLHDACVNITQTN